MESNGKIFAIIFALIILVQSCTYKPVVFSNINNRLEICDAKYQNQKTKQMVCNPIGYEELPESDFSLLLKIFF
ncbi:hypothetical protein QEJ31_14030 [Pigmentibacter sp. JX0631]|uniref:hypothetical protein n=1 Tax=Pigmentibacter sp. JX0631 TaxID=2976982 RepID=UPI002468F4B7|nr:hypothetical protein [Pigmentibacter sp. JX0631]WGL59646.1 hypothetical protein QEJ31_14030 [Pigmentibacter sp. JX0631]